MSYRITGYYSADAKGIADHQDFDNWEDATAFAHNLVSDGLYTEITDTETGGTCLLDHDSYFNGFEGEFPIRPEDLKGYTKLSEIRNIKADSDIEEVRS